MITGSHCFLHFSFSNFITQKEEALVNRFKFGGGGIGKGI